MILALLIAIGGWAYVVYNFYPNTDVKYSNVPITFSGMDVLADRGLGITASSRDAIDVTLNQKRTSTGRITGDDISVMADVSSATEGDNGISLRILGPDGTSISETDTRIITVSVEKVKTAKVSVFVEYENPPEFNSEPVISELSNDVVTVVGAKAELDSVDRVVAYINASEMSEDSRNITRELVAVDKDNKILPHIVTYPDVVNFKAEKGNFKSVRLNVIVTGITENGYTRTYTSSDTVTIKGKPDIISGITEIYTKSINISGIFEDAEVPLTYELPQGVYIANRSYGMTLSVKATPSKDETTE